MASVHESVEVDVPVSVAYNQWTQFEEFPLFMEGVKWVRQLDDTHLEWTAEIGGEEHSWQAEIGHQEVDRLVSWRAIEGKYNSGKVTFEPLGANRTRIEVELTYDAEGWKESAGSALGFDSRRVSGDLDRFKELVETREMESGGWRGEVHEGLVTDRLGGGETIRVSVGWLLLDSASRRACQRDRRPNQGLNGSLCQA